MKQIEFTVTQNFGDKELEYVFVGQSYGTSVPQEDDLSEIISAAKECVCVVAEDAFSGELIEMLGKMRKEKGIRIYALVRNIEQSAFESLKNDCIIRAVPNISGNYIICDRNSAFFFDARLRGYAVKKAETVEKLHDMFIYDFWNNGKTEFIAKTKDVPEQTFDVSPVLGNDVFVVNRSALPEKPYDELLHGATDFVLSNQKDINDTILASDARIYLDKKSIENNRESLKKRLSHGEVVYSDNSAVPLCKSDEKWYLSNSGFDKPSDNSGNLFFAEMERDPVLLNAYHLVPAYKYKDAVGKTMLALKDFSPVEVSMTDTEERSFECDHTEFRKIISMSDEEKKSECEKRNLLNSDKFSASVDFHIKMTVSKLSGNAHPAEIYDAYKKINEKKESEIKKLKKASEDSINENNNELKKIEASIKDESDKKNNLEKKCEGIKAQIEAETKKKETAEKSLAEVNSEKKKETEKEIEKIIRACTDSIDKNNRELRKITSDIDAGKKKKEELEKKRQEIQARRDSETKKKEEYEKIFSELPNDPCTVEECKRIAHILKIPDELIPPFDKPRFGTLYKTANGYEYVLKSDDDYDEAKEEMEHAGVSPIKFVDEQ